MAHFAKIGEGNIVETVVVVHNDVATTEQAGIDFLKNLYKDSSATWVQTADSSDEARIAIAYVWMHFGF